MIFPDESIGRQFGDRAEGFIRDVITVSFIAKFDLAGTHELEHREGLTIILPNFWPTKGRTWCWRRNG